jgi:hypothetical protein
VVQVDAQGASFKKRSSTTTTTSSSSEGQVLLFAKLSELEAKTASLEDTITSLKGNFFPHFEFQKINLEQFFKSDFLGLEIR